MSDADAAAGLSAGSHKNYQSCQLPEEDPAHDTLRTFSKDGDWSLTEEFWYGWHGSTELMVDFVHPLLGCFLGPGEEDELRKEVSQLPILAYNPLWWLAIACLTVVLIPGHCFHTLLGNGDKLRPDELEVETRARVGWVYTYSGSFLLFAIIYLVWFIWDVCLGDWNQKVTAYAICFFVGFLYLGGDVHLLYQMRMRNTIMTQACIISRITFGVAFLLVFILLMFHTSGRWSFKIDLDWHGVAWQWTLSLIFCIFMVVAVVGYAPLLSIDYEERPVRNPPRPWALWFFGFLAALGPACVLIGLGLLATIGRFGRRPVILMALPFAIIIASLSYRSVAYGCTWERTWATLVALGPFLLVFGSFSIAGPDLWQFLSG